MQRRRNCRYGVAGGEGGWEGGQASCKLQLKLLSAARTRAAARDCDHDRELILYVWRSVSPRHFAVLLGFLRVQQKLSGGLSQGQRPPSGPADKGTLTSRRFSPDPGLIGSRYACPGKASPRELPSRSPRSRIVFVEPLGSFLPRRSTPKFRSGTLAGTIVLAPLRARRLVFIPS